MGAKHRDMRAVKGVQNKEHTRATKSGAKHRRYEGLKWRSNSQDSTKTSHITSMQEMEMQYVYIEKPFL